MFKKLSFLNTKTPIGPQHPKLCCNCWILPFTPFLLLLLSGCPHPEHDHSSGPLFPAGSRRESAQSAEAHRGWNQDWSGEPGAAAGDGRVSGSQEGCCTVRPGRSGTFMQDLMVVPVEQQRTLVVFDCCNLHQNIRNKLILPMKWHINIKHMRFHSPAAVCEV